MSYPEPHLGFTQLAVGRENRSGKKGKIKGNGAQKRRRLAAFLVLVLARTHLVVRKRRGSRL